MQWVKKINKQHLMQDIGKDHRNVTCDEQQIVLCGLEGFCSVSAVPWTSLHRNYVSDVTSFASTRRASSSSPDMSDPSMWKGSKHNQQEGRLLWRRMLRAPWHPRRTPRRLDERKDRFGRQRFQVLTRECDELVCGRACQSLPFSFEAVSALLFLDHSPVSMQVAWLFSQDQQPKIIKGIEALDCQPKVHEMKIFMNKLFDEEI